MKHWWINNSWRFWAIRWALSGEPYQAVEIWQEYRHMSNPDDERSLVDLLMDDEYSRDVDAAMRNPVVRLVLWVRCLLVNGVNNSGDRPF